MINKVVVFLAVILLQLTDRGVWPGQRGGGEEDGTTTTAAVITLVDAFTTVPATLTTPTKTRTISSSSFLPPLQSARETYFQLEEREDADVSVTELFCDGDGTLTAYDTDGPPFTSASGYWKQHLEDPIQFGQIQTKGTFYMTLRRTYPAGNDTFGKRSSSSATNNNKQKNIQKEQTAVPSSIDTMGDFEYDVQRSYKGTFVRIGDRLGVSGKIYQTSKDMKADVDEIGYFEMVDTSEDRFRNINAFRPQGKIQINPMVQQDASSEQ